MRGLTLAVLAAAVAAATLALPGAEAAVTATTVISAGPITKVVAGQDLSCQAQRTDGGDVANQWYPDNGDVPADCGTFLAIDPSPTAPLYAPDFANHCTPCRTATTALGTTARYTPATQSSSSGSITTAVTAGTARLEQTDTYTAGESFVRTVIKVTNNDAAAHDYRLWRAGDCALGGDDLGYGVQQLQRVACSRNNAEPPTGRYNELRAETLGAHSMEGKFSDVWGVIAQRKAFDDTCACGDRLDNAIGLSWDFHLAAGASKEISFTTVMMPGPIGNKPPTVAISVDSTEVACEDAMVRLTGIYGDPDGTIASVAWDLGDGSNASSQVVEHAYAQAGTYTVTLTVTDDLGGRSSATVEVNAAAATNCCPSMRPIPALAVTEGQFLRFYAAVEDFERDPLLVTVAPPLPRAAHLDPLTGYVFWRTGLGDAGTYNVTFHVTDGQPHSVACVDTRQTLLTVHKRFGTGPLLDSDEDGIADLLDNCPAVGNTAQADLNRDGIGDACQDPADASRLPTPDTDGVLITDLDRDGIPDATDTCPGVDDPDQADLDEDKFGDLCDADVDGDLIPQTGPPGTLIDNCPRVANPTQQDSDGDGVGDDCGQPVEIEPKAVDFWASTVGIVLLVVLAFVIGGAAMGGVAWGLNRRRRRLD